FFCFFFFSSRRRHTRCLSDWSSDVCSSDLFVGATLSSTMWHWHKPNGLWEIEQVIAIPPIEVEGWPFAVPSLITDFVISMDDRRSEERRVGKEWRSRGARER